MGTVSFLLVLVRASCRCDVVFGFLTFFFMSLLASLFHIATLVFYFSEHILLFLSTIQRDPSSCIVFVPRSLDITNEDNFNLARQRNQALNPTDLRTAVYLSPLTRWTHLRTESVQ
jgi:hypothetical protein